MFGQLNNRHYTYHVTWKIDLNNYSPSYVIYLKMLKNYQNYIV